MLTIDDGSTIKSAIIKRMDAERGCSVADVQVKEEADCIAVGVLVIMDDSISTTGLIDIRAFFDLPPRFDIKQLHNEIDEIAESCKAARKRAGVFIAFNPGFQSREKLPGTGRRNWHGVA